MCVLIALQHEIQSASCGQDLNSVELLYEEHLKKHEEIMQFRKDVEKKCKEAVSAIAVVSYALRVVPVIGILVYLCSCNSVQRTRSFNLSN